MDLNALCKNGRFAFVDGLTGLCAPVVPGSSNGIIVGGGATTTTTATTTDSDDVVKACVDAAAARLAAGSRTVLLVDGLDAYVATGSGSGAAGAASLIMSLRDVRFPSSFMSPFLFFLSSFVYFLLSSLFSFFILVLPPLISHFFHTTPRKISQQKLIKEKQQDENAGANFYRFLLSPLPIARTCTLHLSPSRPTSLSFTCRRQPRRRGWSGSRPRWCSGRRTPPTRSSRYGGWTRARRPTSAACCASLSVLRRRRRLTGTGMGVRSCCITSRATAACACLRGARESRLKKKGDGGN